LPERPPDRAQAERFERLVLPHLDAAYRLARWLARDEAAAQDLVQDACLRAWRFFGTLRSEDARPWLMRIVRNQWFSQLRADAGRKGAVPLDDAEAEVERTLAADAGPDGPEVHLLRGEDGAVIRRAMAELPDEFREVLVLREVEDMSYRDLAEATGSPIGTVMSRLSRARRLLGERVRRLNGEAGDGTR
jgi:RNA polymerase sigma-70 factor (ECF subfamily)